MVSALVGPPASCAAPSTSDHRHRRGLGADRRPARRRARHAGRLPARRSTRAPRRGVRRRPVRRRSRRRAVPHVGAPTAGGSPPTSPPTAATGAAPRPIASTPPPAAAGAGLRRARRVAGHRARCPGGTPSRGVGRGSLPRLAARRSSATELDLDETYEWGWDELARLEAEKAVECDRILPGEGFEAVRDLLVTDPAAAVARRRRLPRSGSRTSATTPSTASTARSSTSPTPLRPLRDRHPARGQRGGAVLHAAVRGPHPARPHLVPDPRPHEVRHLGRGDDRLPRGRARAITCSSAAPAWCRSSGPTGSGSTPPTARAGRSTPSASWTSSASSTRPTPGSASCRRRRSGPCGSWSTSGCTPAARSPTAGPAPASGGRRARRRATSKRAGGLTPAFAESEVAALPELAGPGHHLQARRAGLARGPGGRPSARPAPTSTSRRGTPRPSPSAPSASTTSPGSSRAHRDARHRLVRFERNPQR